MDGRWTAAQRAGLVVAAVTDACVGEAVTHTRGNSGQTCLPLRRRVPASTALYSIDYCHYSITVPRTNIQKHISSPVYCKINERALDSCHSSLVGANKPNCQRSPSGAAYSHPYAGRALVPVLPRRRRTVPLYSVPFVVAMHSMRRSNSGGWLKPTAVVDDAVPVTVLDGLGQETLQEVTVDVLKNRFFVLGLQTGLAMNMFVISTVMMVVMSGSRASGAILEFSQEYYPLFRALFLICFFGVFHGIDLYIWKRCGINYRVLLGVPHAHNYHSVIRGTITIVVFVFSCFVLYVLTLVGELTPNRHVWPALAGALSFLYIVAPVDWMPEWADRHQRYGLLRTIGRVLASPFSPTTFAHTFVADILTSMPKIFVDLQFTACLYASGSAFDDALWSHAGSKPSACNEGQAFTTVRFVLSVLPFWIRLLQVKQWDRAHDPTAALPSSPHVPTAAVRTLKGARSTRSVEGSSRRMDDPHAARRSAPAPFATPARGSMSSTALQ